MRWMQHGDAPPCNLRMPVQEIVISAAILPSMGYIERCPTILLPLPSYDFYTPEGQTKTRLGRTLQNNSSVVFRCT